MDPDDLLLQLRHGLVDYREAQEQQNSYQAQSEAENIADLFEILDDWLAGGGFLPRRWQREGRETNSTPQVD